jgi:hypothetical protein
VFRGIPVGTQVLTDLLLAHIVAAGAEVHRSCAVTGIDRTPTGWTVRTDQGPLGADAVVRPASRDGFAPERRGAWEEGRDRETKSPAALPPCHPAAPLRLLEPPEPVEVAADTSAFTWRGQRWPITERGSVERLSGDWWASRYARDYSSWTSEGTAFVVFLSGETWSIHGWYD